MGQSHSLMVATSQSSSCSPSLTIERMVAGMTVRADARLSRQCLLIYQHRRKVPFQIAIGHHAKLIEAQS